MKKVFKGSALRALGFKKQFIALAICSSLGIIMPGMAEAASRNIKSALFKSQCS